MLTCPEFDNLTICLQVSIKMFSLINCQRLYEYLTIFFSFKLGREEPAMSMDSNGKIIFAKHSEISQANLKNLAGAGKFYVRIEGIL